LGDQRRFSLAAANKKKSLAAAAAKKCAVSGYPLAFS
jgi:hypothetical protein